MTTSTRGEYVILRPFPALNETKKGVIARQRSCRGNPILTTKEKPSLRGNEVAVAIPLFAIRNCLNETTRFTRGNNFVVGLKFMTDPNFPSLETLKRNVIARQRSCRGNLINDYNPKSHHEPAECRRGDRILATTEKPSLRGNEVAVAIPLFAIRKCLNETPRRFAPRGDVSLSV